MQYYNIVKQKNGFTLHKYFRDPTILADSCCLKSIHQHASEIRMCFLEFVLLDKKKKPRNNVSISQTGAQTPKMGGKPIIWPNASGKLHLNERNCTNGLCGGGGGYASLPTPFPDLGSSNV